jgi:hypothetical protein
MFRPHDDTPLFSLVTFILSSAQRLQHVGRIKVVVENANATARKRRTVHKCEQMISASIVRAIQNNVKANGEPLNRTLGSAM